MLVAGVVLAIGTGLANVTSLFRSQLPNTLPTGVTRAVVVAALGIGIGLALTGALHLRAPGGAPRRTRRRPASRVEAASLNSPNSR